MLMGGVALSRLGLWMFDLSVIQQMQVRNTTQSIYIYISSVNVARANDDPSFTQTQDGVSESDRCIVGGVQNSLQSTLDLMTYIMGIVISNPQVMIPFPLKIQNQNSGLRFSCFFFGTTMI